MGRLSWVVALVAVAAEVAEAVALTVAVAAAAAELMTGWKSRESN